MTPGNWRHGIPETSGASLARLKKELEPELCRCLFAIAATPFKRARAHTRIDVLARVSPVSFGPQRRSDRSNVLGLPFADRGPRGSLVNLGSESLWRSMGTDLSCAENICLRGTKAEPWNTVGWLQLCRRLRFHAGVVTVHKGFDNFGTSQYLTFHERSKLHT